MNRFHALEQWINDCFPQQICQLYALSGDASFRRYFRVQTKDNCYVIMDAPPTVENCEPFIKIAQLVSTYDIRVPHIYFSDLQKGFLLLSDFGDRQLLPLLNDQSADALYVQAINVLSKWQCITNSDNYALPKFDQALFDRELALFTDWFFPHVCGINISQSDLKKLQTQYQLLIDSAFAQPQVFVHRDYHSRNLMLCDDHEIGVLDFQDAVFGPITYDLVSLLRDCYIAWPIERITEWVRLFYNMQCNQQRIQNISLSQFTQWFDWMGLQRNIKCLGIFARLVHRDNKQQFLKEIPRVFHYALQVSERYAELSWLNHFLRRVTDESDIISSGFGQAHVAIDTRNT